MAHIFAGILSLWYTFVLAHLFSGILSLRLHALFLRRKFMLNKPALQKKQIILFASDYAKKPFTQNLPGQQDNVNILQTKTGFHWISYNDQERKQCSIGMKQDNLVNVLKIQHGKET